MQIVRGIDITFVFINHVVDEVCAIRVVQIGMEELTVSVNQSSGIAIKNYW